MAWQTVNLNQQVRFVPTEGHREIWRDHHRRALSPYSRPEFEVLRVRDDGFTYMPLWEFARVYGPEFMMGSIPKIPLSLELCDDL